MKKKLGRALTLSMVLGMLCIPNFAFADEDTISLNYSLDGGLDLGLVYDTDYTDDTDAAEDDTTDEAETDNTSSDDGDIASVVLLLSIIACTGFALVFERKITGEA